MSFSNNSSKQTKTLNQILTDLVNSLDGIYSGFCVDREGLLIEEVNLEGTLGKESSLILCSLMAGVCANMDTIGREIGGSPWVSFISESSKFKLYLRTVGNIAFLGVLTDPYVDFELLKLIVGPGVDAILQTLQQRPETQYSISLITPLASSQKEIDDILTMEK
ncbi:MAG: roadblock/LC7 domain-containing protein [Candidatus Hodarchaeota archaeon]